MEIRKRLLVPYSAEQMFDLIEAAEHYPEFMPWCARTRIVERSEKVVVADIVVDFRGVRFEFRTRNPKCRPGTMSIRLEKGPFRQLEGEWRLTPLGDAGCRVEFEMRYDFNSVMARVAGPVFDRIANAMVDAYVARADTFYGRPVATPGAVVSAADSKPMPNMSPNSHDSASSDQATAAASLNANPAPNLLHAGAPAAADAARPDQNFPGNDTP
jgi:ribosome-associated toxin RatA of RatAB toxin-antitoxin module